MCMVCVRESLQQCQDFEVPGPLGSSRVAKGLWITSAQTLGHSDRCMQQFAVCISKLICHMLCGNTNIRHIPYMCLKKQNSEKRADYLTPVEVRVYVPEK